MGLGAVSWSWEACERVWQREALHQHRRRPMAKGSPAGLALAEQPSFMARFHG